MKRNDLLKKLGYYFPESYRKRVIVCTDAHNEADDQFAIVHHLLTPTEEVLGIVASHYEYMTTLLYSEAKKRGWNEEKLKGHIEKFQYAPLHHSVDLSYDEVLKIKSLMGLDDVPVYKGLCDALEEGGAIPQNDGVDFIISEARKRDKGKLYVCFQGAITDMAAALIKAPDIADNVVVIWIGGGKYPDGSAEFNLMQDVYAANCVFSSEAEVWQIPSSAYSQVVVSFTELIAKFRPCGDLGRYLVDNLLRFHSEIALGSNEHAKHRDAWILGDNPTVSVLAVEAFGNDYHLINAPQFGEDYSYIPNKNGKLIRVYDDVHERFIIEDLAAKLKIVYGG
ncbi:MAG: nucleoside hydrolase [Candidatus Coproplasma sp.]